MGGVGVGGWLGRADPDSRPARTREQLPEALKNRNKNQTIHSRLATRGEKDARILELVSRIQSYT